MDMIKKFKERKLRNSKFELVTFQIWLENRNGIPRKDLAIKYNKKPYRVREICIELENDFNAMVKKFQESQERLLKAALENKNA